MGLDFITESGSMMKMITGVGAMITDTTPTITTITTHTIQSPITKKGNMEVRDMAIVMAAVVTAST